MKVNKMCIFLLLGIALGSHFADAQLLTTFNLPKFATDEAIFNKDDISDGRLILTPYLEAGQKTLARKLAKVNERLFLNTSSYAGNLVCLYTM